MSALPSAAVSQSWRRENRLAVAFAAVILVASLLPVPDGGSEQLPALLGVALDKWVHAAGYGTLTVLFARNRRSPDAAALAVLVAAVAGYGAAVELLQLLSPTRTASSADMLANAVGACVAGLAWRLARRD